MSEHGLLPVLLLVGVASLTHGQHCTIGDAAHLTATMQHNISGHWIVSLSVERPMNYERPAPVHLDVRPMTNKCGSTNTQTLAITLSGPPPGPSPVLGYEKLDGFGYYKAHPEILTWEEANAACISEGAHLLVLNSERERVVIREFLKKTPSVGTWPHIGFHAKEKIGTYLTIFGETLTAAGFDKWHPGEPTNINTEICGAISKATVGLADIACGIKESFVCEF